MRYQIGDKVKFIDTACLHEESLFCIVVTEGSIGEIVSFDDYMEYRGTISGLMISFFENDRIENIKKQVDEGKEYAIKILESAPWDNKVRHCNMLAGEVGAIILLGNYYRDWFTPFTEK